MTTCEKVPLLEVKDLRKSFALSKPGWFSAARSEFRAVNDVSFDLHEGRTLALVGESGCGKTTTARMVLQLTEPSGGEIRFEGVVLANGDRERMQRYRSRVQAVFQDPWSALNPRLRVGFLVAEPLRLNTNLSRAEIGERVDDVLRQVGLEPAAARSFPHEFSGGQRQRIAIARAIALRPQLIVLDEPVSALDVSVRLQVVNLLIDLQRQLGIGYLLISHDLATVRYQAHDLAVMYRGAIVESGLSEDVFERPLHPYTQTLLEAARFRRPEERDGRGELFPEIPISTGETGCSFQARCPLSFSRCRQEVPALLPADGGHSVACHLHTPER